MDTKDELQQYAQDYDFVFKGGKTRIRYNEYKTDLFDEYLLHPGSACTLMEIVNFVGSPYDIRLRSLMFEVDRKRTLIEVHRLAIYVKTRTMQYLRHKIEYCMIDISPAVAGRLATRVYLHMFDAINYLMQECLMLLVDRAIKE